MSNTPQSLRLPFSLSAVKTKGLTFAIEHAPCCILSFAAGFVGLPVLNHNPVIELGFAVGGALVGEHIGHRLFRHNHAHGTGVSSVAKRYGLALAFGVASWGAHQALFHDHAHVEAPASASAPHHHHDHH